MRRRFEKRVYIALPEAPARTNMLKLNLGDTPHDITEEQFEEMGHNAEGIPTYTLTYTPTCSHFKTPYASEIVGFYLITAGVLLQATRGRTYLCWCARR